MPPLLLPAPPDVCAAPRAQTASLVLVLSPVRAPDGTLRVRRQEVPAGQSLATALPPRTPWQRVIWNGGLLPPDQWETWLLRPGDEVWCFPQVGDPAITPFLITFAIGLAVSIATTALTYVLFPPSKPHMTPPDERTFSFSGIQTAIGPGNVVPVIYGRHRVGGQLLSAYVELGILVSNPPGAPPRATITASNPPRLTMVLALCEGPIEAVLTDTLELNGQPWANYNAFGDPFNGFEVRLGTPDQTPIPWAEETRNTFADGRQLPDNSTNTDQQIIYTTTQPVDAFILNVVFLEGLFQVNGKGEKEDNTVTVTYRTRVSPSGPWTLWSPFDVHASRTAPVRLGIRQDLTGNQVIDIAINYGAIRHADDLHAKWRPTLESVTEINYGTFSYPNTAILALRTVASEALQGALPNVTVEVKGKRVRVGTFSATETWSDNPAWCVMDFLSSQRYGLSIPDAELDLFGFATWAAYNDESEDGETRHTFNYVLDRDARAQSVLLEMMGGSRTLLMKGGGLWTPRPTRNDLPVQLLSWSTCTNLRITYTRDPDRINVMEARFANEADHFEQDVLTWPTVENWPPQVNKASLDIRGVTKPSRIMRALQFELNRRQFENVTIEFDNALDATTLQVHDIFRFAHPLPGWGKSGRVLEGSTSATLYLDEPVTMEVGTTYHVYLRHTDDTTEARVPINFGATNTRVLQFGVAFSFMPTPRETLWAFGQESPEGAVRLFRVVKLQRKSDTTVSIQAVIHNPSIYDEPVATPLPVPPGLFNPLGPPPALTFLIATELTRIQPSGASLKVVNLAWDIGAMGPGQAPYGGATILRRTVLFSASAGSAEAGTLDLGTISDPNDPNTNFIQLVTVTGHVLETDDYTVVTGGTYLYRVIPISGRGVPNMAGARDALIHVAGPTTAEFFPGTVRNLRLRGQAVGKTTWEGHDVHLQWDPVEDVSGLFSETFFVQDYIVQVWAPGREYLLRSTSNGSLEFTYSYAMNQEDQVRTGHAGARRDLLFLVWAHTNTNRISLDPASLLATNPPPDMSVIIPDVSSLAMTGTIKWDQYAEPRDIDHYELHLDTMNPPIAIVNNLATAFHGYGNSLRVATVTGLTVGVTYYIFVLPYDTFGPGIATETVSFVGAGITAEDIDAQPPDTPTGLTLTTGTQVSDDGTILAYVEASWDLAPESDAAGYEVHVFFGTSNAPTIWSPNRGQHLIHFIVPGNTLVRVKLFTFDRFHNISDFCPEATITSARDTAAPAAPSNLVAVGSIRSIALLWTPPSDADYAYAEIWSATTNNRATASVVGTGITDFIHEGLGPTDTRYYWIRAFDTSGNAGTFAPASATAGVSGTAGQLNDTFLTSLVANKILAGNLNVLVRLGVANLIELDGVQPWIGIREAQSTNYRVMMGRLGPGATEWGLRVFNSAGQTMWNLTDGATTEGISNAAVTSAKIQAGSIEAQHIVVGQAVITQTAHIANAIITDAKITGTLAVERMAAGHINVGWFLGQGGNISLDGVNQILVFTDDNGFTRILQGKLGPIASDYGLNMYNSNGDLMWHFDAGASTLGIQNLAVTNAKIANAAIDNAKIADASITNAKIANAAISNAKIGDLEVDSAKIANLTVGTGKIAPNAISASLLHFSNGGAVTAGTPVELARLTWPALFPGDVVWMLGCGIAIGSGQGGITTNLNLREDSISGTLYHHNEAQGASEASSKIPILVQSVFVPSAFWLNKVFVLESTGIGTVNSVSFVGLRLQK